jgi:hypothetical protein
MLCVCMLHVAGYARIGLRSRSMCSARMRPARLSTPTLRGEPRAAQPAPLALPTRENPPCRGAHIAPAEGHRTQRPLASVVPTYVDSFC